MNPDDVHYVVAVAALIFRNGRVLAMRRAPHKDAGPGLWETLSGRVQRGEEPLEAVAREIREECALAVEIDPRPVTSYHALRNDEAMIVILYRARYLAGEVVMSDEHDAYAWLSADEFAACSTLDKLVAAVREAAP